MYYRTNCALITVEILCPSRYIQDLRHSLNYTIRSMHSCLIKDFINIYCLFFFWSIYLLSDLINCFFRVFNSFFSFQIALSCKSQSFPFFCQFLSSRISLHVNFALFFMYFLRFSTISPTSYVWNYLFLIHAISFVQPFYFCVYLFVFSPRIRHVVGFYSVFYSKTLYHFQCFYIYCTGGMYL